MGLEDGRRDSNLEDKSVQIAQSEEWIKWIVTN